MLQRVVLCIAVAIALICGPVFSQSTIDALVTNTEVRIDSLRARLKTVQAFIDEGNSSDEQFGQQKAAIESIQLDTTAEISKLRGPLSEVAAQQARLGPKPQGDTLEAPAMAAQRRILDTRTARLAAIQKQFELLGLEAAQQQSRISVIQRNLFFERIFKSDKSVLNPRLWYDAGIGTWAFVSSTGRIFQDTYAYSRQNSNPAGLLLLPACAAILFMMWKLASRAIGIRPFKIDESGATQQPSIDRLWRALLGLVGLVVITFFVTILISSTLDLAALLTPQAALLVESGLRVLASFFLYSGVTYILCAPRSPQMRLIAVDDTAARTLPLLVGAAAIVASIGTETSGLFDTLKLPLVGLAGHSATVALLMIGLIGLITIVIQKQARQGQSEGTSYFLTWFVKFLPIVWVLLGVALLSLVLGYISLGYFITGSILDTAFFIVVLALLHSLADALSENLQNPISKSGQLLRQYTGLSEVGLSRIALIFRTSVDILLVALSIPVLFLIWTVTWIDLTSFFSWIYNGVTVGNITISPMGILVALLVFALGVIFTRMFTNWLQRRVLSETTFDKGVQDSVRTGTRYLGYILAVSFALSAAGLDFSNVAIVAGALGVGIGFGLQSIVNNFVSGLILLAERPVRVGDWVVTNAGEGLVKKINVRSTEIETFDSCTVIIPNSNLITEAVKNWTHRDSVGRFNVSIVVSANARSQVVADVLKSAAQSHPKVLRYPEPQVLLSRFLPQGVEYELKGHVADVFEAARVASDIRFEVTNALQKKRIVFSRPS